ncbi:MAG: TetR/AcrR family transcriptional regulator [Actinomycetota bacterium]|nr:TetR/AcrR family transcriptional regulator [Actinomycetota bacterium]
MRAGNRHNPGVNGGATWWERDEDTHLARATSRPPVRTGPDISGDKAAIETRLLYGIWSGTNGHLEYLAEVRNRAGHAGERLEAVLVTYALISHDSRGHHDTELAALMHRGSQVARAEQHLRRMIRDLITEGQKTGYVRGDVTSDELVSYCLHALTAASSLPSKAAVRRLVAVTLAGLCVRA